MLRKLNDPNLDVENGEIFGSNKDVFRKKPIKYQKAVYSEEWKDKDTTKYLLRPVKEYTRREMKAIQDMIRFPDDYEELKTLHPVMDESKEEF